MKTGHINHLIHQGELLERIYLVQEKPVNNRRFGVNFPRTTSGCLSRLGMLEKRVNRRAEFGAEKMPADYTKDLELKSI